MPSESERRAVVNAKKALAELEATATMTMRGDTISAKTHAVEHIESFIEDSWRDTEHLVNARDALEEHKSGAVGDARFYVEQAIEHLEAAVGA